MTVDQKKKIADWLYYVMIGLAIIILSGIFFNVFRQWFWTRLWICSVVAMGVWGIWSGYMRSWGGKVGDPYTKYSTRKWAVWAGWLTILIGLTFWFLPQLLILLEGLVRLL